MAKGMIILVLMSSNVNNTSSMLPVNMGTKWKVLKPCYTLGQILLNFARKKFPHFFVMLVFKMMLDCLSVIKKKRKLS